MKANGYLSSERAADIVGVLVCDLYDPSREGLARLYGSVSSLCLCRVWGGDSDKEKHGQESGLEESGHVRDEGASVSVVPARLLKLRLSFLPNHRFDAQAKACLCSSRSRGPHSHARLAA